MTWRGPRRRRALIAAGAAILASVVFWRFPPFHLVSIERARAQQQVECFNPAAAAAELWQEKLVPAMDRAVDVKELLGALSRDPAAARQRYGRTGALGGAALFVVRGSGRVRSADQDAVIVGLDDAGTQISLPTGPVFGNAVRDAPGLLDISTFPSSQDFNDLSTELNRIIETRIVPELRQKASVGKAVRFVGCVELDDEKGHNLLVIPVRVEWP